jgi:hypothetical protein
MAVISDNGISIMADTCSAVIPESNIFLTANLIPSACPYAIASWRAYSI